MFTCIIDGQVVSSCGGGLLALVGTAIILSYLIVLAMGLLIIVSNWKIFVKAGKPGWAALVPVYNIVVILEIIGKPLWWVVLSLIPGVQVVIFLMLAYYMAKAFGKGIFFTLGIIFLPFIFLPILAFGKSKYISHESKV